MAETDYPFTSYVTGTGEAGTREASTMNADAAEDMRGELIMSVVNSVAGGILGGLATGVGVAVGAQVGLRAGIWLQPRPMPHQMASWLEHPLRLRYRNPGELLGLFGLYGGMTVADLGCGTGLFAAEMARMVGRDGLVHAVDLQAPLLAQAAQRVEAAGLGDRVRFHRTGIHALLLEDSSVDVAVMVAVLGEVPAVSLALDEVRRILKPGGRLAVSEEVADPAYAPGPMVRRWATSVGFRFGGITGNPFCYSMIFFNEK